jgi:hypothetical protein
MKKSIFIALATILIAAFNAFAQIEVAPSDPKPTLDSILAQAQLKSENYRETFKNLLADELKTFEDFDKNGNSDEKTTVKSSFLVYQSGKNAKSTAELRNVLEVNGKLIPDSQKRGEEFLAELDKQTTLESELKKLESEGLKYDKTWRINGLTLNQAVALAPNLRSFFDFKLDGTENIEGSDYYIVSYLQTKKSPNILVNEKDKTTSGELTVSFNFDVPGDLKKTNFFLRGKLWIDAKTFQIRREERELISQSNEPLILLANVFEYQSSDYGILVPKNITLTIFKAKKEKGGNRFLTLKDNNINFEYSKFRQTNVDVKILDDEPEK